MIIGKIMMVQNSNPANSVNYLISKKILLLKAKIKNYTLEQFIDEVGVSRTSMVRYMKSIGITRFSRLKGILYDECMKTYVDFKKAKEYIKHMTLSNDAKLLAKHLTQARRVLILGDGNRYSLVSFQKGLTYLGVDTEIPVYLGSEEEVIRKHRLSKEDLVIIISLHESYESFLDNRATFYLNGQYLEMDAGTKIGFIGTKGTFQREELLFEITIQEVAIDGLIREVVNVFQEAMLEIILQRDLDTLF